MLDQNIHEHSKNKILILGSNGQLGRDLSKNLSKLGEVTSLDRNGFDFENPESLDLIIKRLNPKFIVNAAAFTNVDGAESFEKSAYQINSLTVKKIAILAHENNAVLIHFSTDYVFDGLKEEPYLESDTPNPISVYGNSKLEGENYIAEICSKYLILRTSGVISKNADNFISKIINLSNDRDELNIVSDQESSLNFSGFISQAVLEMLAELKLNLNEENRWGIYHLSGQESGTWYEFAKFTQEISKKINLDSNFSKVDISPISSSQFIQKAKRPKYSFLSSVKLKDNFGIELPNWKNSIIKVMENNE
ncbi:dTDP-4-dehydrorhamnose reductase [SAR86 cluster bacterium]|nr:dTDP-4-dehydrorhamnose reductase [SAR86 cluster bacterium]